MLSGMWHSSTAAVVNPTAYVACTTGGNAFATITLIAVASTSNTITTFWPWMTLALTASVSIRVSGTIALASGSSVEGWIACSNPCTVRHHATAAAATASSLPIRYVVLADCN